MLTISRFANTFKALCERSGPAARIVRASAVMSRGKSFVCVLFAVAVLCSMTACKPKPGDSCAQGRMACIDATTGIFCGQDGKFATMSCNGGCSVSGGTLTCNNDLAAAKDGCALVGDAACTKDNHAALQCGADNKFAVVETCKGARGCSISGDRIDCDNDTSDIGDPCRVAGDYACTPDKGLALRCDDHKMAPLNTCRGPKACRVIELPQEHRVDFVCDDSKAEEGDACDTNGEEACSMDQKSLYVCKSNKFASSRACSGSAGCTYEERGDKYTCDVGPAAGAKALPTAAAKAPRKGKAKK